MLSHWYLICSWWKLTDSKCEATIGPEMWCNLVCVTYIVEWVLNTNLILIFSDLEVRFNYELKHLDTDRLQCTPTSTHKGTNNMILNSLSFAKQKWNFEGGKDRLSHFMWSTASCFSTKTYIMAATCQLCSLLLALPAGPSTFSVTEQC